MSLRHKVSVKRCSSSFSTRRNFEGVSGMEGQIEAKSNVEKDNKVNKESYGEHSKNGFMETPDSAWIIPREEKLRNRERKRFPEDSQQTYQHGSLIENAGNITNLENMETTDDEDIMIQKILKEHQSSDDWEFDPPMTNSMTMSDNGDGRRSRKGFTSNIYSSDEFATAQDICCDVHTDKSDRFMSSRYGSQPRPKTVSKGNVSSGYGLPLAEDMSNILQHDFSRLANQSKKSIYGSISRPTKNNLLSNNMNNLDNNILTDQSARTSMSSGYGVIPRPKKKDSTRRPKFTDDLMLSRDIDQILEEEVGDFVITAKPALKNCAISHAINNVHHKPKVTQEGKLASDIQYIQSGEPLLENSRNGPVLRPQNKNSTEKLKYDDDIEVTRNMDTIVEEEVGGVDPRGATKASKLFGRQEKLYPKEQNNKDILLTKEMHRALNKADPSNSTPKSQTRAKKNLPINNQKHFDDIMLDIAIEEILEIPVIGANISLEEKVGKILSNGESKRNSMGATNKPIVSKEAVAGGSLGKDYKMPEDYTIEELIGELFPDLLPEVIGPNVTEVPNVELQDISASCSSIQTLNRDSICSVTNGDALRPMAVGSSKTESGPSYSKGNRTCAEKGNTGVIYTDEDLNLMAQIEREYGIRTSIRRH